MRSSAVRPALPAAVVFLALAGLVCQSKPPGAAQTSAELDALENTRDQLRERLAAVRAADPRLLQAPAADVLIGMPVTFTSGLVQEVTRAFLDQVEIVLRDIKVHKEDDVKAKTWLGTITPGRFVLDLALQEVHALLKPGMPEVDFKGDRLSLALPVALSEGEGRATVTFDWKSSGLGSVVCEDFKVVQQVSGRVAPHSYTIKGGFALSVEDGLLVAGPDFPDLVVRLIVEPSEQTWRGVDAAIKERSWKCEKALNAVNVTGILKDLLAKGFNVRVPKKIFKPIRLPAGLQASLSLEGQPYALGVTPLALRITPDILWFGADVSAGRGAASPVPPAATARPSPAPGIR